MPTWLDAGRRRPRKSDDAGANPVVGSDHPGGVTDNMGPSEGLDPGSIPGRDTASSPRGVADGTQPCEGWGPGSTPGGDTDDAGARRPGDRLQSGPKWVRLPPASLPVHCRFGLHPKAAGFSPAGEPWPVGTRSTSPHAEHLRRLPAAASLTTSCLPPEQRTLTGMGCPQPNAQARLPGPPATTLKRGEPRWRPRSAQRAVTLPAGCDRLRRVPDPPVRGRRRA